MRFHDRLRSGDLAITLEITPPRKRLDEVLLRRARALGPNAHAVNVIQREGRLASLDASIRLRDADLEPVWHLVTRGRARAEIESEIASAAAAGIEAVLCVRGDHASADAPDTPRANAVVGAASWSLSRNSANSGAASARSAGLATILATSPPSASSRSRNAARSPGTPLRSWCERTTSSGGKGRSVR